MSPIPLAPTVAARYDRNLRYAHGQPVSAETPQPKPTAFWPPENVACLERYREWLLGGGTSEYTTDVIYLPMAGHVLGLELPVLRAAPAAGPAKLRPTSFRAWLRGRRHNAKSQ